jgi:O-antigen ligase
MTALIQPQHALRSQHCRRSRRPRRLPAWPLTGVLLLYPLWWVLGLGVLIFFVVAVPMAVALIRWRAAGRPVRTPPGFPLWLLFLATVLCGLFSLGADPAGTVPGTAASRLVAYGFRVGGYLVLTVLLLYAGNLEHADLSQRRLATLLAWLFVITVGGGLLGMAAPHFEFTAPVELFLPGRIRHLGFVQSLVHPSAAQIMDLIGGQIPRPGAPWGYTNTWGNNVCLLVGWLIVAGWSLATSRRAKVFALGTLVVATAPIVYSLNRGLWIGLGVMALYVAIRLAVRGRLIALAGVVLAGTVLAAAIVATPLGEVVNARIDDGKSNGVRLYTTQRAIDGMLQSPLIGFGSTRNSQGGRNSIAVGESADCARCGNFTIGGNGQLWQLLFAHGLLGTLAYLGFFAFGLWRFRRDASPIGLAAAAAIVSTFAAMFWYNSLVTPLALTFLAYAALWRNLRGAVSA